MSNKLTLERLVTFCDLAEKGSIAKVALDCGMDESTVQKRLSDLDEHFERPLKHFTKTGVRFTEAGKRLLKTSREMIKGLADTEGYCRTQPLQIRVGAGDRLLHWLLLPKLWPIQSRLEHNQIELFNYSSKEVVENVSNLRLDLGLVRLDEAMSDLKWCKLRVCFEYALFVQEKLLPQESDNRWVIQHAPMAVVAKFQSEMREVAKTQGLMPNIRLLCATFPQARRAVSSGYAAILPESAFAPTEMSGIKKFELPFEMPQFDATESNLALIWSKRSIDIRPNFRKVIDAFKKELCESPQKNSPVSSNVMA